MQEVIASALRGLTLTPGRGIWLGYSGGVDSEVLANLLAGYGKLHPELKVTLVHVHHGLSANADAWAQHCAERAACYGLAFRLCRVTVPCGSRTSLESEARKVRYQAIRELMAAGDILLTGHHQDDQLETQLLALKRGQGPRGLAAMGMQQVFADDCWLVRPLLNISRREIEDYATSRNLVNIEDESNFDTKYDRNFLRQEIIPALKSRWPHIAQTAGRSAALCAEQQLALDEVVSERLTPLLHQSPWGCNLDLQGVAEYAPHWQRLLLRAFIEHQRGEMPTQVQLEQALEQLLQARDDASVALKFGQMLLQRYAGQLFISRPQDDAAVATVTLPSDWHSVALGGYLVEAQEVQQGARIHLPRPGEVWQLGTVVSMGLSGSYKCHPHFRDRGRELKKCWQEAGVPPWLRQRLPVLVIDGCLAAVPGVWLERRFLKQDAEPGLSFSLSGPL